MCLCTSAKILYSIEKQPGTQCSQKKGISSGDPYRDDRLICIASAQFSGIGLSRFPLQFFGGGFLQSLTAIHS